MINFIANDINDMALQVYPYMRKYGIESDSRNGRVLKLNDPCSMTYTNPRQRACFIKDRDANPFFHIAESMWMLAGRNDVEFLSMFNGNIINYSDDGKTFNAAYGYRLRHHFGFDQLKAVTSALSRDKDTRQAVCQLWDANDLVKTTKDKACNMMLVFTVVGEDRLDMTIYNRSNDAIYGGVTGANPVHMSYFQQWVANQLELYVGNMTFISTNLHVYLDLYPHWEKLQNPKLKHDSLHSTNFKLGTLEEIELLCNMYMDQRPIEPRFNSDHLNKVVVPIINAWMVRKYHKTQCPYTVLQHCEDRNLFLACLEWMEKRDDN